eukprot:8969523-Alexandrium_andersonii.AAC.1
MPSTGRRVASQRAHPQGSQEAQAPSVARAAATRTCEAAQRSPGAPQLPPSCCARTAQARPIRRNHARRGVPAPAGDAARAGMVRLAAGVANAVGVALGLDACTCRGGCPPKQGPVLWSEV